MSERRERMKVASDALLEAADYHKRQACMCHSWMLTHTLSSDEDRRAKRKEWDDHERWEAALRLVASNDARERTAVAGTLDGDVGQGGTNGD